ncbi:glutaredoxin domain-containing protein [Actinomyces urogenitalis]|uniref:glutaredoxin domain-containing protein n=1 Tax=Actinomyces urogenitalis TaxID=103621 RepID=UPI00254F2883|nr:glutaredoxin domain-containing protein [Actinomyces urogenitalis]MDK8237440.1 glutaredoxin domain-containing protein [Actinomyces urogenitalis]MDU5427456.1 glutaredoxin domain-containing protein [Actinomyces urogenitalis]WOO94237.1 glutaredoxin domain-containing protein [Actinomyces urogenitalis]
MAQQDTAATIIYAAPDCPGCRMTKQALERQGVPIEVVDLSKNPDILERLKAQGFSQAPVVVAPDGQTHSGFRPDRIKAIVAQARSADPRQPGKSRAQPPRSPIAHQAGRRMTQ